MNKCLTCKSETPNPKFCSRSCSASHNNRLSPRRVKVKVCKYESCEELISSSREFCSGHRYGGTLKNGTIGQLRQSAGYQAHAYARYLARAWAKEYLPTDFCWHCGYYNHVEVCHIRDLNGFPDDVPVMKTYENNLVILCPNHHWELDHGVLSIEDIVPPMGVEPIQQV